MTAHTSSVTEFDAARLILARMGITPADLLRGEAGPSTAPTFAEYVPQVSAAVTDGTRRVYGAYWNRVLEHWGHRRLDEPSPSEIQQLSEYVRIHVVARRNARGGRSASEHLEPQVSYLTWHHDTFGWTMDAAGRDTTVAR